VRLNKLREIEEEEKKVRRENAAKQEQDLSSSK